MSDVISNLAYVRERIAAAARRAGRDPAEITLVAVSKTHPADVVAAAYRAGIRHFGENRVEEGAAKIPAVRNLITGAPPTWHMVGHVQGRKAEAVVESFDYIHSVDRLKIAQRLSRFAQAADKRMPVLLECNLSGEESKFGFDLQNWERDEARRAAFCAEVEAIIALPGLVPEGLMTMAPLSDDPERARPVFAALRRLLEWLQERFPTGRWHQLSMGMTDDFEVAVEEGATMVRLGRAIFGER